ncbi:radical SAM protein [Candidatus Saganbacteria bacterium]|nr:radical SAM protein [Candidatus Saganbacteria bacterium]
MKVLLLNPPYEKHFIRSARWAAKSISGSNWYPIWLAYCTGLLGKQGHEAKLVDALVESYSIEKTVQIANKFSPGLTVIYISTASLASDVKVAELIKEKTGSKIVLVGPWCAVEPSDIINSSNAVDAIALYEFDYTILEIAQEKELKDIKGLWWKRGGEIIRNPLREPVTSEELNGFPFVTDVYKRHLDIRKYFQAPQLHPFVDLFTGRGCAWGKCVFCLWPYAMTKGAPYRMRKIENVIDEIKYIKKELSYVKEIFLQDDTLQADRAREFSKELLRNNIKTTWSCYSRANLDFDTLKIMKESGCRGLHVGYESADPKILRSINKGVTVEEMEKFTNTAYDLGFIIHADFIIGLPGETTETIKTTIRWAKRLKAHSYQFVTPKAYRNTPLYTWAENHHIIKNGEAVISELSSNELDQWVNRAIKECHLNIYYLYRMMRRPYELGRMIKSAWFVIFSILSGSKH